MQDFCIKKHKACLREEIMGADKGAYHVHELVDLLRRKTSPKKYQEWIQNTTSCVLFYFFHPFVEMNKSQNSSVHVDRAKTNQDKLVEGL